MGEGFGAGFFFFLGFDLLHFGIKKETEKWFKSLPLVKGKEGFSVYKPFPIPATGGLSQGLRWGFELPIVVF